MPQKRYILTDGKGNVVDDRMIDALDVPDPVIQYSKTLLLDALAKRNIEDAFFAALEQQPKYQRRWDAANVLESNSTVLTEALPFFCQALGMTAGDAQALLDEARI